MKIVYLSMNQMKKQKQKHPAQSEKIMKPLSDGQLFIKYLRPFNGYVESYSISSKRPSEVGWSF